MNEELDGYNAAGLPVTETVKVFMPVRCRSLRPRIFLYPACGREWPKAERGYAVHA